jgi:hypothetical protein
VCQEETYFLELVRYIHLNPLRAGIVDSVAELDRYAYCGQSALLGKMHRPWQDTAYVLRQFGKTAAQARKAYQAFVEAGIPQGRRPELTGGGLIRSLGGWTAVKEQRFAGETPVKSDERILGESDFVEAVLRKADEQFTRQHALQRKGVTFERVVARVAKICDVEPRDVMARGRQERRAAARSLLCFWLARELGIPLASIARQLGMSPPGVSYAAQRGEALVRKHHYKLAE